MGFVLASVWMAACSAPDHEGADSDFRVVPAGNLVFPREVPIGGFAALANTRLVVEGDAVVDDRDELAAWLVAGVNDSEVGSNALLGKSSTFVDVYARAALSLGDSAVVTGDAVAIGAITMGTNAYAASVHSNTVLATPRTLTLQTTFPPASGSHYLESAGLKYLELAPGSYDQVSVEAGTELVLGEGTYHIHRLKQGTKGLITFDPKDGPAIVYVAEELILDGSVESKGPVAHAAFVYLGNLAVNVAGPFAAHLFAPNAAVTAGGDDTTIVGGIAAFELEIRKSTTFEREPFGAWAELLALGSDPPPPPQYAWVSPAVCDTPQRCCHATMDVLAGTVATDSMNLATTNACVLADAGDDSIVGFARDAVVIAGSGHDHVSVGIDVRVHGGNGDDLIETLGDSIVFGNAGNDHILVPGGINIVTPGPGRDVVELGPGDDTIVIADACELSSGEVLDAGDGQDELVSPLSIAELGTLGVTVRNVETVRIERNGCTSECRAVPECGPAGVCSESPTGLLSCTCDSFAEGTDCSADGAPEYHSVPAPSLGAVPAGTERAAAEAFVDWMVRARVGDEKAIRTELDHVSDNHALRDAFVSLVGDVFQSHRPAVVIPAIEAVAYLRCRDCEAALEGIVAKPLVDGGHALAGIYLEPEGNEVRAASIAIARAAIGGLAFQGTKASRAALLEQIEFHPDAEVRLIAIQALRSVYGDTLDADIAAVAQPTELAELSRPL